MTCNTEKPILREKKKKRILLLVILLIIAGLRIAYLIYEYGVYFYVDDYIYKFNLRRGEATIKMYFGSEQDVVLPRKVGDFYVIGGSCWIGDFKYELEYEEKQAGIIDYRGEKEEVVVPGSLDGFWVYNRAEAFKGNDDIKTIIYKNSINGTVYADVEDCENLEEIVFEEGNKKIITDFHNNDKLTTVVLPKGVEEIGGFSDSKSLENVKIPNSLKIVKQDTFIDTKFWDKHCNDKYFAAGDDVLIFLNQDVDDDVIIPYGIKHVCHDYWREISDFKSGTSVYIPDGIEDLRVSIVGYETGYIAGDSYKDLSLDCDEPGVVVAQPNSQIEYYCKEQGIEFRPITDEEMEIVKEKTEAAAKETVYQK